MGRDEEFKIRLSSIFRVEASEHIAAISSGLFWLEGHPDDENRQKTIENVYRSVHSLKGAARTVDFREMEILCQTAEDIFAMIKKGEMVLSGDLIKLLHETNDFLGTLVEEFENELDQAKRLKVTAVFEMLDRAARGIVRAAQTADEYESSTLHPDTTQTENVISNAEAPQSDTTANRRKSDQHEIVNSLASSASETIRVSAPKLEAIMRKAEELVAVKLSSRHYASEITGMLDLISDWGRHAIPITDELKRTGSSQDADNSNINNSTAAAACRELLSLNDKFRSNLESRLHMLKSAIYSDFRSTSSLVDELLIDMKSVLMMPFSYTFSIFPRMVRDISREQGKEIDFILEGDDVEIDKRVIQEMKDPLVHLIRNSIDHGIEAPDLRLAAGKPSKGTLRLAASQVDGGRVEIIISDDGGGINLTTVRNAAVKYGIISASDADSMSDEDSLNLVFESGVSTSPIITTVSGRGLGMAIVREKAEMLGGSVSVETVPGKGTTFRLLLPVNLATFRGVLIESKGSLFVVPTKNIERLTRVHVDDVKPVEGIETVTFGSHAVSLVRLSAILELSGQLTEDSDGFINVMIVPAGSRFVAFDVDRVISEDEMLFKNMGPQLTRVRNIAGATVLADGTVVPVLNVQDLVKSAMKMPAGASSVLIKREDRDRLEGKKSVLVVEDSITARALYVNILESSGYMVTAAVDGIDGYTKLINGSFDLVVSDIQMPKMTGFELTEKIRNNQRYANLPVILVTGLESAEDKKRGIDAGANAYIVKSSFDQNNLLEVIRRFV